MDCTEKGNYEGLILKHDSCIPLKMCVLMFLQTVRAAGGGEASEGNQKQTGSLRRKQTEGQRVSQGKTNRVLTDNMPV